MVRSKTLRRLPPVTRKYARLLNELQSIERRLKNILPEIERLEIDSLALRKHSCTETLKSTEDKALINAMSPEERFKVPIFFK